jgi:hypothetical protein
MHWHGLDSKGGGARLWRENSGDELFDAARQELPAEEFYQFPSGFPDIAGS